MAQFVDEDEHAQNKNEINQRLNELHLHILLARIECIAMQLSESA